MNRSLKHIAALLALGATSHAAHGQPASMQTGYVQCIIHHGDGEEVTEITPVTEITMPMAPRTGKNIQFLLSGAFRSYLLQQDRDFYQVACLENGDVDALKKSVARWEGLKGYGIREKREIEADQFWPDFLDFVYAQHRISNRTLTRASYSYSAL